jgi:serine/threonine protein kinase
VSIPIIILVIITEIYEQSFICRYGSLEVQNHLYIIIGWCEHGNLEEYLKNCSELDWSIKLKIAVGIANGLVFCHHRDIFHHDIRSHNILLDINMCAKLSGFHLSRKDGQVTTTLDQVKGAR